MMGSGPAGRLLLYSLVKVVLQVLKLNIFVCQSVNKRYDPGVKSTLNSYVRLFVPHNLYVRSYVLPN